jgi:hypothetical protein
MKRTLLLPNPVSYIDYVNKILIDSFLEDVPTVAQVEPTTQVARILVNEEGFLIIDESINGA